MSRGNLFARIARISEKLAEKEKPAVSKETIAAGPPTSPPGLPVEPPKFKTNVARLEYELNEAKRKLQLYQDDGALQKKICQLQKDVAAADEAYALSCREMTIVQRDAGMRLGLTNVRGLPSRKVIRAFETALGVSRNEGNRLWRQTWGENPFEEAMRKHIERMLREDLTIKAAREEQDDLRRKRYDAENTLGYARQDVDRIEERIANCSRRLEEERRLLNERIVRREGVKALSKEQRVDAERIREAKRRLKMIKAGQLKIELKEN